MAVRMYRSSVLNDGINTVPETCSIVVLSTYDGGLALLYIVLWKNFLYLSRSLWSISIDHFGQSQLPWILSEHGQYINFTSLF